MEQLLSRRMVVGAAANITYNTTSGNNTSLITTGALTVGAGTNTAAINYQVRTNGATISVPAIAVPGYIQLDNSCLGCATPVTTSTAATNGAAITITGALSAGALAGSTGVTINAVANGTGIGFTQGANAISSAAGGITITVNGQTGTGYSSSGNLTAAGQAITVSTATANVSATSAGAGISTSGLISGGAVTLVATQSATATLVPITATGTITANSLTVTGTGGVSTTVVSLGIITINAGGGNITITGNNAAAGTNTGITQTGAITNNAVGSNISFISNNDITQGGAITLVANTGTPAANITYNTTSGNNTSLITTGALTVGAGTNTAAINYQVRTNGATISVPAIAVPGYIQLDNSCLGCATPVTTSTAATNGAAITITGALSAGALAGSTGVTINAVANGTGIGFTQGANAISSAAGGITITVNGQTGTGYSSSGNLTAAGQAITVSTATANVSATSAGAGISTSGLISGGAVTLVATQSATATLVPITATGTITANSLTVTGTGGVSTTVVSLGIITINAGGGNITITGNNAAAGTNTGITQTGAITNNAVGSNISFISNNDITQGGAITLVANTGTPAANITYNTTSGNNTSLITTGALTVGAGTNTAAINYQVRTNGATISVPAIAVPGYIQLDNSCLGCATPVTTSTAATNGAAITITGALSAGALAGSTGVTINAVANGTGIGFTQGANAISSAAGGITITVNGQTGTGYSSSGNLTAAGQAITVSTATTSVGNGINNSGAISGGAVTLTSVKVSASNTLAHIVSSGLITANSLTVNSSGGLSTVLVSLGAITINAGGGNISITANSDTAGGDTGIYQIGAITNNAAGSNISFISNNIINQVGAIALAANTGSPAANVIYDTTSGTRASNISGGVVTVTSGVGSVINYIARSAGSAIWTPAIGTSSARLPGTVTLDNTFGCATAPCTKVSGYITNANASTLATASTGITVSGAIHSTGSIAITGVSSSAAGVNYAAAINSSAGSISINGTSVGAASTSYGIHGSNAAGIVSAANTTNGFVSYTGISTLANLASDGIRIVASATITGGAGVNLYADGFSGNIITAALITNSGTSGGVTVNAYGNVSTAGITNSGANGIRIISGRGIAAGTTTGGTITAVGTLTNNAGVIGISMAAPGSATGDTISTALKISSTASAGFTIADAKTNIAYGITGGIPVEPGNYTGGNFINYRQRIAGISIAVTLNNNYSAVYGTAFNSNAANDWLQSSTNASVSVSGSTTATFGLSAASSVDYAKSVLIFSPTVGGSTSLNGTNANAVQAATTLTASSLSASDGSTVTLSTAIARTYTITPAVLGISVSGVYNGTTTFTSSNATITTTGLASWDRITSVTVNSANANGASTFVSAFAGNTPATVTNTFSASNYLINTSYNGTLSSGVPVNAGQVTATNRVNITPAPIGITVSGVYTGTTSIAPTAFTVTGLVNNQTITAISTAVINNINVSANNSNFVSAVTVSGGTASIANYNITPAYNTTPGSTQNTVTLTPKALTISGIAIGAKTYDGTSSATVTTGSLVGVASIDTANVILTQVGSFATANAGTGVAVNVIASIAGSAIGNYSLTQPTGITATITRKTLTVGGTSTAASKVYDGSTAASVFGGSLVGVVTADIPNVSLSQSGTFAQTGVGTAISVTVSASLDGSAAGNYLITQPANLSANITVKTVTVSGTVVANKVYNGTTAATVTAGTLVGVIDADSANVTLSRAASFSSANAGTAISVTMSNTISGSAAANYALVQPSGIVANITPAPLGIRVAAVYSGSTTIAPSTFTVTGLVNSETITGISSAVINSMNVSANSTNYVRSITIASGTANANNYAFSTVASTTIGTSLNAVTLTAKTLTVNGTIADSKVYDATTTVRVWGGTLVGVVGIDAVNLSQSGVLNSANVGNAVAVTMTSTISGFSAANYTLVQPSGVTAAITPRVITISDGTVANKVYDGTTDAVITGGALVGVLSGDINNVVLTQAGRFSSPNVSNGIIIIASGSISGSAASNYSLVQPAGITANITPAMLGISVVGVANGTNNITPISYTLSGLIGGQTITGLSSVSVKSSSISSNGSNFVTGIVISGGTALATNYAFAPSYSASAGITQNIATLVNQNQRILTVTGTVAATKVYDATTQITVSGGTLVGVTGSDNVTLISSATLLNANVSSAAAVALNYSLGGTHAANYLLVQPTGITTIVTPAPIGIVLAGEYTGTTTIVPSSYTVTGLLGGQTITSISSAVVNSANVSSNGSNFVTSIVSGGGTALLSNYQITPTYNASAGNTINTAIITPKALTVGGVSVAANKVYDGSVAASISGGTLVGVIGSDNVTLNQSGTFAQATKADAIAVTATNTLGGTAATNYSLVQPTGITANITAKELTVSGAAVANKVYNGTNSATVSGGVFIWLGWYRWSQCDPQSKRRLYIN
jgi:mucin-19